ncbi:MAG: HNH endonuclease [Actinomycetes bacterium]
MHSNATLPTQLGGPDAPTLTACADTLHTLFGQVDAAEVALMNVVAATGEAIATCAAEAIERAPLETVLAALGVTSTEGRTYVRAARLVTAVPAVMWLWRQRILRWSQVRLLVSETSRCNAAQLVALDDALRGEVETLAAADADQVDRMLVDLVAQLRTSASLERTAERQETAGSWLAIQPDLLHGNARLFGELTAVDTATVVAALDANADAPQNRGRTGAVTRARQRAGALVDLCLTALAGGTGGTARPSLVVHVDLTDLADPDQTLIGRLEGRLPGAGGWLTRRTIERLSMDARLRVVLRDGMRPLAVSAQTDAIPQQARVAIGAVDGGCRWPGCDRPISWTDLHHLTHRSRGGSHTDGNLVALCRRHHRAHHDHGWHITMDPATRTVTITSPTGALTATSVPKATRLRRRRRPPRGPTRHPRDGGPAG